MYSNAAIGGWLVNYLLKNNSFIVDALIGLVGGAPILAILQMFGVI